MPGEVTLLSTITIHIFLWNLTNLQEDKLLQCKQSPLFLNTILLDLYCMLFMKKCKPFPFAELDVDIVD